MKVTALLFCAITLLVSCKTSEKTGCIDEAKIRKDAVCPMNYAPVCGCDGKTYGNECQALNAGVTSFTKGECR